MTYVSIARFDVKPGAREAFLAAFDATGMLGRPKAIPGFRWARLAESIEGSEFVVVGEWDSQAGSIE
jgi:heme-degrading monooxygenase HmoA